MALNWRQFAGSIILATVIAASTFIIGELIYWNAAGHFAPIGLSAIAGFLLETIVLFIIIQIANWLARKR